MNKKADDRELSYIVERVNNYKRNIKHNFFNHYMNETMNLNYHDDGSYTGHIMNGVTNLYRHICVYLELKGLFLYLDLFKAEFSERVKDKEDVLKSQMIDYESYEELIILDDIDNFLSPFIEFSYEDHRSDQYNTDINKLKSILSATATILNNSKVIISGEASIYKAVNWIIQLYFYSTRNLNKAGFISQFKTYNPDILIPELETAIEYKYIRSGSNIDEYIDQVRVDSINYKGDDNYKNFIAVVCLQDRSNINESIRNSWQEKEFPRNWELIIVYV